MKTIAVVSGYFSPVHIGHVRLMEAARALGDYLIAIVNNDIQQVQKKGKIIIAETERLEVVRALRAVDEALIAVDQDRTVSQTLERIAQTHPGCQIIFANGGDRDSAAVVPETAVCERYGIKLVFDVGGADKANSSSNIYERLGIR
jgi:cytidyltransferase-like protein